MPKCSFVKVLMSLRDIGAACALALTVAPVSASQLIDNLNAGKSQTLVLYGTSETQYGRWANVEPGKGGIVDWLASRYGNLAKVINSGMQGRASNTGLANLSSKVLAHRPDTVIIEFSMNDAYTKYKDGDPDQNISLEKSLANLNAMIDQILAANGQTEIILQTMNSVIDIPEHPYYNASNRPDLAAYYQGYRDVAKKRGLLLIDNFVNWETLRAEDSVRYRTYLPDGLHPTAPGSLAITMPEVVKVLSPGADKGGAR